MKLFKKAPQKKPERHPKLYGLNVGDVVRVCADENRVKVLQAEVGGYSSQLMKGVLGKNVRIKHIFDTAVKVSWENKEFDLHPEVIEVFGQPQMNTANSNVGAARLFKAIQERDLERVCAEINIQLLKATNEEGYTLINAACVAGDMTIVTFLLEFGCDLNVWDKDGNLPIHNCVWLNHFEILREILERSLNQINNTTQQGKSMLHVAVIQNNEAIVRYLIDKGIDINIKDQFGKVAYQYRTSMTNPHVTQILEDSSPFSMMELELSSVSLQQQRISSPRPFNRLLYSQRDYAQMYLDSSFLEPPRDEDYQYSHRSASDETDRIAYERNILSITSQMRSYEFITIPPVSGNLLQPPCETSVVPLNQTNGRQENPRPNGTKRCDHNEKKVVFVGCSHTCCSKCAETMVKCHVCDTKITNKMIIYL